MKPEYHIEHITEKCYKSAVEYAKNKGTHIECLLSKEDIGHLIQDKAVTLYFLNDDYDMTGMLDIKLSDDKTEFNISNKVNNMLTEETVSNKKRQPLDKIFLKKMSDYELYELMELINIVELTGNNQSEIVNRYADEWYASDDKDERIFNLSQDVNKVIAQRWRCLQNNKGMHISK